MLKSCWPKFLFDNLEIFLRKNPCHSSIAVVIIVLAQIGGIFQHVHHTWKLHFLPQLALCVLPVHVKERREKNRGGPSYWENWCEHTVTYNYHFRSLCKTHWSIKRALIWDYKFSCCEFPCISRFFPFPAPYFLKNQEIAFVCSYSKKPFNVELER